MNPTVTRTQTVQITCINKQDRNNSNESISHVGGNGWRLTRQQAVDAIEREEYAFYTNVYGKVAWVGVRQGRYGKYLQTHADGQWNNNLLALDECS